MKKIICALAVGIGLSLIGCPPGPGGEGGSGTGGGGGDAANGGGGGGGGDTAPADDKVELSHVKVGQKYTYTMSTPGAPPMQMVYEVKEVGPNFVKYTTQSLMDMGQGLSPVGDPQPTEWKYEAPPTTAPTTTMDAPKVDQTREKVKVGDMEFHALVTTSGNTKSWTVMSGPSSNIPTFPLILKSQTDGNTTMELTKVE
jgi:hypothetical protein